MTKVSEKYITPDFSSSEEVWKTCVNYPTYEISNFGRLKNIKTKKVLALCRISTTINYSDSKDNIHIAREMLFTFRPNIPTNIITPIAGYLDGNSLNIRLDNLYWINRGSNQKGIKKTRKIKIVTNTITKEKKHFKTYKEVCTLLDDLSESYVCAMFKYSGEYKHFKLEMVN